MRTNMNIQEINSNIQELEVGELTSLSCRNLASLYIVREHLNRLNLNGGTHPKTCHTDEVVKELDEVLPQYHKYCETKRNYQLSNITKEPVIYQMKLLCKEIQDLIEIIYTNTDMAEERQIMEGTLKKLYQKYC